MKNIVFIHGMFQNPKSWDKWESFFTAEGYNCFTPAWPLHDGEPADLRANIPAGLGDLTLDEVIAKMSLAASQVENPVLVGHSVGGLIVQKLINNGIGAAGVAISSVAPNKMLDFDWNFFKSISQIANPLKGDEPALMDAESFHKNFANTLSEPASREAFEQFATHDSRNVLRGCMGEAGHIDLSLPHAPLLFIGGEKDLIIPPHLNEKNADAYHDKSSRTLFREFPYRSHFICGEEGWEDVAQYVFNWIEQRSGIYERAPRIVETGQTSYQP